MKIKQPNYRCPVDCSADDAEIDVEISTASLLAELEKRRPGCLICKAYFTPDCHNCIWGQVYTDKFKPAK